MTPTIAQREFLGKYLRQNLKYRETYTEFYDHILTALEALPGTPDFWEAVTHIVTEDFGEFEGMGRIEARYKNAVTAEIKRKYLNTALNYVKLPLIGITASLAGLFYILTKQPWFNLFTFFGVMIVLQVIPGIIKSIWYIRSGFMFTRTKKSVKDGVFDWLDYIPAMLFVFILTAHSLDERSPAVWFATAGSGILTFLLVLCAIHTITFCRVYTAEFKLTLTR